MGIITKARALAHCAQHPVDTFNFFSVGRRRRAVSRRFIHGRGIEVGAGTRPFPIPAGAHCFYGDVRDRGQLETYFSDSRIAVDGRVDAQTMAGIEPASLDFVISAHVIEHLLDPVGAIRAAMACLRPGGVFLLVAPEMTRTFDRARPPTTIEHVLHDAADGGEGTRLQAYLEHARYVHPVLTGETLTDDRIQSGAVASMVAGMDVHVHAWREPDFYEMLAHVVGERAIIHRRACGNENVYVIRKSDQDCG